MKYNQTIYRIIILFLTIVTFSCNKKSDDSTQNNQSKDFKWKPEIKISDIPDSPVKGFINGKEISINYSNFEQWRGSGDNVFNFGDVKPLNNCGYLESDNSFHLIHKAGEIKTGDLLKTNFDNSLDGYTAYYETNGEKNSNHIKNVPWNCALQITAMEDKIIKGKIAICFNDEKKSWVAGTFEAIRCNN